MSRTTVAITAKHAGKCQCGADVTPGVRAEYDFTKQAYTACPSCANGNGTPPAAPAPPVAAPAPFVPPAALPPAPYVSPLDVLESVARTLARNPDDVRRIVDCGLAAMVRAAWEGGAA